MATLPTSSVNRTRERIMNAARELAQRVPLDRIGLSEVARRAGVSWPTVKRHVGSKDELRQWLLGERPELRETLPDTRRRLLDAAARVFATEGYEGATLDAVAGAAGLTKGAVYWHFQAKSDVLGALLGEYARRQRRAAQTADESEPVEPREALRRFLAAQLQEVYGEPEWRALLFEFVGRRGQMPDPEQWRSAVGTLPTAARDLVHRLQSRGEVDALLDPEVVGALIAALIRGLVLAALVAPADDDGRALEAAAVSLLVRGLGGR